MIDTAKLIKWNLNEQGVVTELYCRPNSEWVNPIDIVEIIHFYIKLFEFRLYHYEKTTDEIRQQFDDTVSAFAWNDDPNVKTPIQIFCEDTRGHPTLRELPSDNWTAEDFEYDRIYDHLEYRILFSLNGLYECPPWEDDTEEDIQNRRQDFYRNIKEYLAYLNECVRIRTSELTRPKLMLNTTLPFDWRIDSNNKIIFRWNAFSWVYSNDRLPPLEDLIKIVQGFIDVSNHPNFTISFSGYKNNWIDIVKQLTHDSKTFYDIYESRDEDTSHLKQLMPQLVKRMNWYAGNEVVTELNSFFLNKVKIAVALVGDEESSYNWTLSVVDLPTRKVIADKLPFHSADGATYLRFIQGYLQRK